MAQTNIQIVRRATEALNRGDFDAFLQDWAPDAVLDWSQSRGLEAKVFRGHDEIRAFAQGMREVFGDIEVEIVGEPVEVDEDVLVVDNLALVRGRDGIETQARSAWLITLSDGEQTSLTLFQTKQDALDAATSAAKD